MRTYCTYAKVIFQILVCKNKTYYDIFSHFSAQDCDMCADRKACNETAIRHDQCFANPKLKRRCPKSCCMKDPRITEGYFPIVGIN